MPLFQTGNLFLRDRLDTSDSVMLGALTSIAHLDTAGGMLIFAASDAGNGIQVLRQGADRGLDLLGSVTDTPGTRLGFPSSLSVAKVGSEAFLVAGSFLEDGLTVFRIDQVTGALTLTDTIANSSLPGAVVTPSGVQAVQTLSLASGTYVYGLSPNESVVQVHRLNADGTLDFVQLFDQSFSWGNVQTLEVASLPGGQHFLLAGDGGPLRVNLIDPATGALTAGPSIQTASGPRIEALADIAVWAPAAVGVSGHGFVFVAGAPADTVEVFRLNTDGTLVAVQTLAFPASGIGSDPYSVEVVDLTIATEGGFALVSLPVLAVTAQDRVSLYHLRLTSGGTNLLMEPIGEIDGLTAGDPNIAGEAKPMDAFVRDGVIHLVVATGADGVAIVELGGDNDTLLLNATPGIGRGLAFAGQDVLVGDGTRPNLLVAGPGRNVLTGGAFDDTMVSGSGNDVFFDTGPKNDFYLFLEGVIGQDRIDDNAGQQSLYIEGFFDSIRSTARSGDRLTLDFGARGSIEIVTAFETVDGTKFNVAEDAAGISNFDVLDNQTLLAGTLGSVENEVLVSDGSGTAYDGAGGSDLMLGGAGTDRMLGGAGDDILLGFDGADTLTGGAGLDRLRGGTGNDTYVVTMTTSAEDRITEEGGTDTLRVTDRTASELDFRRSSSAMVIEVAGTTGKVVIEGFYSGPDGRVETIVTTDGVRNLRPGSLGTATGDVIVGTSGFEMLDGLAGNDVILGNGGDDTLTGGAGNDHLRGGTGNDTYRVTMATTNEDRISERGGNGTDTVQILDEAVMSLSWRRSGALLVAETPGGSGKIVIENHFSGIATERVERVSALDGVRFLKTDLIGTATSDIIVGASGEESLDGGGGNDIIAGGGGKDTLRGGAGLDVFVYASVSDSTAAAAGRDTILDFLPGTDRISLRGIDAHAGDAGDQAFVFLGLGPTGGIGTLAYSHVAGNTLVQADVNGGGADFSILLAGVLTLSATDFLL